MFQNIAKIFFLNFQEIFQKEEQSWAKREEFTKTKKKFNLKVNLGKYLDGDHFSGQLVFTRLNYVQKNHYGKKRFNKEILQEKRKGNKVKK